MFSFHVDPDLDMLFEKLIAQIYKCSAVLRGPASFQGPQ